MPSGTINGTTANVNVLIKCEWSESNVNIANNTSDVTAVIKMCRNDYDTLYWTRGTASLDISIGGQTQHVDQYVSLTYSYGWVTVTTITKTVPHDANGSKTCNISVSGSILDTSVTSISLSGDGTLTPIARASQPSTTNGTFGSAITINTNRASTSFTHTLTMTMGSHSETKTGVGASLSWTIPASWADTIPAATSNTLSISCVTYNGSTNIGTKTTSCTATIPDSWKPTVSISKTLTNAGSNNQVLVNVTTVNLTASGTASTGTSISSYSWSGGAVSGTGASKTHSPTTIATFTYTVTVTDRRGRTGSATVKATSESGVSSMSCNSSVNFGSALAVSITRKKASFTHSVTWQISSSYTNTATGQGTSASYTIPTSWAASIPAATSTNMTVTVTTYNGNTSLGSVSKTVSVVVPSSWVPAFTLSAEAVSAFNSQYLKGVSKVKLTASSVSPSTGSQIQSYQFTGNNLNKSATSTATSYNVTSDLLSVVGTNTYTVKVTDKRGRVTTKTTSITVTNYSAPTLNLTVGRYTSGGVADNFGGYGRMTATGTYSAVTGNTWTLTLKQKKRSASSYTTVNTYSNQTGSISKTSSLFSADVDSVYDCQATLTDAVGKSVSKTVAISTGQALMDWFKDKVIGIFSTASEAIRTAITGSPATLFISNAVKNFFNGQISVGTNYQDQVLIYGGTEGGNIRQYAPDRSYIEMDQYDSNMLRLYSANSSGTYQNALRWYRNQDRNLTSMIDFRGDLAGLDMDDVYTPGYYYMSSLPSNSPSGASTYGSVIILRFNDGNGGYGEGFCTQIWIGNVGQAIWIRYRTENPRAWSTWRKISDDTILNSYVKTTDTIAVAHGGTGATTGEAARNNLGVCPVGSDGRFQNFTGSTQIGGFGYTCINSNNSTFNGKRAYLILGNTFISLYNATDNTTPWSFSYTDHTKNNAKNTALTTADTTTSVAASGNTTLRSVSLSAGTWLFTARASFSSAQAGKRLALVLLIGSSEYWVRGEGTYNGGVCITKIKTLSSATTVALQCNHDVGSATNVKWEYEHIRLY